MTAAEKTIHKRMVFGNNNEQVNILIFRKLFYGFIEIIHTDKVKFRIEFGKHFLHFGSFSKIFIR